MGGFKFSILLILSVSVLLTCHGCGGGGGGGGSSGGGDTSGSINLAWEASSDSAVVGHMVYYGTRPGTYENSADAGSTPSPGTTVSFTLRGLSKGQTYYIAVTAYDQYRNESDFSNEVTGLAK
jgi:Purple acid Phosphatase, N-terminal domain